MAHEDSSPTSLSDAEVREAMATIIDPEVGKDLLSLGIVESVKVSGGAVAVTIASSKIDEATRKRLVEEIELAINRLARDRGAHLEALDDRPLALRELLESLREPDHIERLCR